MINRFKPKFDTSDYQPESGFYTMKAYHSGD